MGPHPLHAHKLIFRRWKRTRASSIEREIRDFPLLAGFSAQVPHCGWYSILENCKKCSHSPAGQRKHADFLSANSGGHRLTYSKDNQPFEKAAYVTFYLYFINAFLGNVSQGLLSLDLNPVWRTTNCAKLWFIVKFREWPNHRQITFMKLWGTQETSVQNKAFKCNTTVPSISYSKCLSAGELDPYQYSTT